MSQTMTGYPFGSVVTFAADRDNRPLILISTIAEHTRNIKADQRVSLTLTEGGDDSQAEARLTIVGIANAVPEAESEDAAARYYRRFPHAAGYHRAHDFSFYRIEPLRGRYIGGFGSIHWIETEALSLSNPFSETDEAGMIDHMNRDHADAMLAYCKLFGIEIGKEPPRMSAIDSEGFDLMLGHRLARIAFDAPAQTPVEVRKAMVALVQRARVGGLV
ncbi:MAG: pyridoxamine 5-phosphate oxidase [Hydrocarboniphaga sp.]|nr:pyridoxamine 5-phosphate oxidase [Hydrocarboniphaga sp.]